MLAAEGGEDNHHFGPGIGLEDTGAFVGGGAGGEDIIDEEDRFSLEAAEFLFPAAQAEGVPEVFKALGPGEENLLGGGADAPEGIFDREAGEAGEGAGHFVGLVEPAPLFAFPVERDGDEDPVILLGEAGVAERFGRQGGEIPVKVDAPPVLERVDQFAGPVAGEKGGAGKIEGKVALPTVRADEGIGEFAIEWETALLTEGGRHPREGPVTGGAEVTAAVEWGPAEVAGGRVEIVNDPREVHCQEFGSGSRGPVRGGGVESRMMRVNTWTRMAVMRRVASGISPSLRSRPIKMS